MSSNLIENDVGSWKNNPSLLVHCTRPGAVNDIMTMIYQRPFVEEEVQAELAQYTETHWRRMTEHLITFPINEERNQYELLTFLQYYHKLFCFDGAQDIDALKRITQVYSDTLSMSATYEQLYNQLQLVETNLTRMDLLNVDAQAGRELKCMITRIAMSLRTSFEAVVNIRLLSRCNDPGFRSALLNMTSESFKPPCIENQIVEKSPKQKLLDFYLSYAFNRGYRKMGEHIYRPVFNDDNIYVHSYERHQSIMEFICTACYPETQNEYWFNILTSNINVIPYLHKMLVNVKSERLPTLMYNRDIFAFSNGLYVLPLRDFFWFQHPPPGCRSINELTGNLTAIKYHRLFFDDERMKREFASGGPFPSPLNIHMPHIKSIFQAQGYDDREMFFIFALLGRLFHIGKRFDNWSVFPWFLGIGATGKSTILKLVAMMYNPEDVGYLPNRPSDSFAMASIYSGLLWFALDVDYQFNFDQATWCSMVSHEPVVINVKFKDQISKEWESHGAAASNTMPAKFLSVGGNMTRRIVNIEFTKIIQNSNPNLFEWCVKERPEFLHVLNSCYLMAAEKFRNVTFKSQLPQKFKEMEKRCMREMNPLDSFVNESCVLVNADQKQGMSKDEFTKAYKWWVSHNNLSQQQCKLTNVSFHSLSSYGVREVDSGHGSAILENIVLAQHTIRNVAEWEQNKGR
jgi:hypothetical protein